ncbi:hypothetical protein B9J07_27775 [Sinorhizobium sp. LM21]|uniref:hypothetical protein n=1 Tax=Sinorhizobium sp. LM21 TaxID=1449788 RepID=UPI0005D9AE3C|nr:hypothetical protein [Sinorhizobium sp. LM21]AJW30207.1 hypothetical protein pLM21S1_p87 [Sinorhizobium sp. LM21]OWZ90389.1 hypothetical protein B9J07_27775 [Sinorhizobium sp. LM21]
MSTEREAETKRLYDAFRLARSYLPPYEELTDKERKRFETKMLKVERDLGDIVLDRRRQAHDFLRYLCGEIALRTRRTQ